MSEQTDRARAALLHQLARGHPGAHPHTLALYLSAEFGHVIDGRMAAKLMDLYPADQ